MRSELMFQAFGSSGESPDLARQQWNPRDAAVVPQLCHPPRSPNWRKVPLPCRSLAGHRQRWIYIWDPSSVFAGGRTLPKRISLEDWFLQHAAWRPRLLECLLSTNKEPLYSSSKDLRQLCNPLPCHDNQCYVVGYTQYTIIYFL